MISRIRLDAFGRSVEEVHADLKRAASLLDGVNGNGPTKGGQLVIERDENTPEDSPAAFKGRHILHPDTSEPLSVAAQVARQTATVGGTNP